ncbi:hypothetical protein FI667_g14920, partial [Globisporangium splendens]
MLRPKRHPHNGDDHRGGMGDVNASLMTERQQLAFLLRKTAQEASGHSDTRSSDSSDSDGESATTPRASAPRIQRNAKRSPRNVNVSVKDANGKGVVIYCGRGRPPKNSIKLPHNELVSPKSATAVSLKKEASKLNDKDAPTLKKLKVSTTSSGSTTTASGGNDLGKSEKTSPSSSSDVLHMANAFEGDGASGDFWSLHCALCCGSHASSPTAAAYDLEALFLCPSCDQKYPTQRALGRV